jgi:F-type H+-transporting ATPase subunit alpha
MADLSISPDVIRDALKDFVAAYEPTGAAATEVGTVIDAADGIAHVEGLPGVMANELVTFADGVEGLALNLDEHEIGVVVLGEFAGIEAGQKVTRTARCSRSPSATATSVAWSTRSATRSTVSARSRPRAAAPRAAGARRHAAQSVHEPMQTGIKAIDAMIPSAAASAS